MPGAALELTRPAFEWMPPYDETDGPLVAELCESVGFIPDPEQRLALDWAFAVRGNRSAVRDFGLCAPRQNMKTGFLKMAALGWLFILDTRLVVWSAHEFNTAQEAFRDMSILIEDNPDLDREVLRTSSGRKSGIRHGNGDESIELRGDRRLVFKARTKAGGRGLTGDRIVLDEAMKLTPDMMAALLPTLRAVKDPQVVFAGSGGLLESAVWRSVRDRGRAGDDPSLGWMEYGDPRPWECEDPECSHTYGQVVGCALDDYDRHAACNTALGRRILWESLQADRRTFKDSPQKYATETLTWWEDPPEGVVDDVLAAWPDRADPDATFEDPITLGVCVSHDSRAAAIVACGAGPSGPVVDLIPDGWRRDGTAWIADRIAELRRRHNVSAVGVVKGQPAASLDLPDVTVLSGEQFGSACIAFATAVAESGVTHLGQGPLDHAVENARRKFVGEGWRWSLRESPRDISPLVGAVVALDLHSEGLTYDVLDSVPEA